MKATHKAIGMGLAIAALAVTSIWMLNDEGHEAQSAPSQGNQPIRYDYDQMVDRNGNEVEDDNPTGNPKLETTQTKATKTKLKIQARDVLSGGPVAGAVVRIVEVSGTGPNKNNTQSHDGNGNKLEGRKVLGTIATGTTDAKGRFTANVPSTAVLAVEVSAPPATRWVDHDTPPLPVGFSCKNQCVEVVLQDGVYQWRANGNNGGYRNVNAQEELYYDPLVFLFRCV